MAPERCGVREHLYLIALGARKRSLERVHTTHSGKKGHELLQTLNGTDHSEDRQVQGNDHSTNQYPNDHDEQWLDH